MIEFWLAVRGLMWVLVGLAGLTLLGFWLDSKLSGRKW
jgi:hypothetical protein